MRIEDMPKKQSYAEVGDACATAHALELLGDRWAYPILRELMLAPKRFGELESSVRGITPAVLATRLRELERVGLVRKLALPAPARVTAYDLTDWARELEPTFRQLGRWALASPTRTETGCGLTPDAAIQSMRTMAPHRALRPAVELQLHLSDERIPGDIGYDYRLTWNTGGLRVERGRNPKAAATVAGDSSTWTRVLYDGLGLAASGLEITGDLRAVTRLVAQFSEAS